MILLFILFFSEKFAFCRGKMCPSDIQSLTEILTRPLKFSGMLRLRKMIIKKLTLIERNVNNLIGY